MPGKLDKGTVFLAGVIATVTLLYMLFAYPFITTCVSCMPLVMSDGSLGWTMMAAAVSNCFAGGPLSGWMSASYLTLYGIPAYLILIAIQAVLLWWGMHPKKPVNPELDNMPARANSNECGHDRLLQTAKDLKGHPCISLVPKEELQKGKAGFYTGMCEGKLALMRGDNHLCVIAPTNSGKSRRLVLQNLVTLTQGEGDNFIVTDQKGELYSYTREYLTNPANFDDGVPYQLNVINLSSAEDTNTCLWNPMYRAIEAYDKLANPGSGKGSLFKQVNDKYKELKAKRDEEGEITDEDRLELQKLKDKRDSLIQKAEHEIDILYDSIHSVREGAAKENKFYTNGSRDVIMMVLHYLASSPSCPDSAKTFKTAADIMSNFLRQLPVEPSNPTNQSTFIPLFEEISKLDSAHPAYKHMKTLSGNNKYLEDFANDAKGQLSEFATIACQRMMSGTRFHIDRLAEDKIATFIIIPPHATAAQKRLATMYIEQALTVLMETAERNGGRLPRRMNMVMEELGQLAPISNIEQRLAFTRGAGIRWMLVLQSLNQLALQYGRDALPVILDNCKLHILMGSNDPETKRRYSAASGKYTKLAESESSSKVPLALFADRATESARYAEQACITEESISNWNVETMGCMIFCTGAMTAVLPLPDISKQEFNDTLGMGSVEHNAELCRKSMKAKLDDPDISVVWSPEMKNADELLTDEERKKMREDYIAKMAAEAANREREAAKKKKKSGGGGDKGRLDKNDMGR